MVTSENKKTPVVKRRRKFVRILSGLIILVGISCAVAGMVLTGGVRIQHFSLGGVSMSNCFLIWQDKLHVDIGELIIEYGQKAEKARGTGVAPTTTTHIVQIFSKIVRSITVEKINVGKWQGYVNVKTRDDSIYNIIARSGDIELYTELVLHDNSLSVVHFDLSSKKYRSTAKGKVQIDLKNLSAAGTVSAEINGSFPVGVEFVADREKFSFSGKEGGEIRSIAPLVDLFGLDHSIQRWITDYLSGSRYHLKSFKGEFPWKTPLAILETLDAEVRVDEAEYTFVQDGIDPVKSEYTDAVFKKGVLSIKPHGATFYGQDCGKSWVDIDFNDYKNILLGVYIKAHAKLNDDILTLLKHYKITLPFKQLDGKIATDLTLAINLNKKELQTKGRFGINKAQFVFSDKNIGVSSGDILLENSDVSIDRLVVDSDIFAGEISGKVYTKQHLGDFNIELNKLGFNLGQTKVQYHSLHPDEKITYHIRPEGNTLKSGPTAWKINERQIRLDPLTLLISPKGLSAVFPKVRLTDSAGLEVDVSGSFSGAQKLANISCEVRKIPVSGLTLGTQPFVLSVKYDKGLTLSTSSDQVFYHNSTSVNLYPTVLKYKDKVLTIDGTRIQYGDVVDTRVTGFYNYAEKSGEFLLDDLAVLNEKIKPSHTDIAQTSTVPVKVTGDTANLAVDIPMLDSTFNYQLNEGFTVNFSDLGALGKYWEFSKNHIMQGGSLAVSHKKGEPSYKFKADILTEYPFLVREKISINALTAEGEIKGSSVVARINKDLQVDYHDKQLIVTSGNGLGYNIDSILEIVKHRSKVKKGSSTTKTGLSVLLNGTDTQLYMGPDRYIPADKVHLQSRKGKTIAWLEHETGRIDFSMDEGHFVLKGENLTGDFLEGLIKGSVLQKGEISIVAKGSVTEYSVLLNVKDGVVMKMAVVNNVLAFINTVPALITFSLPGYSRKGLQIKSAAAGMVVKDNYLTLKSLDIKTPEMKIAGMGWLDLNKKDLKIDLTLTTTSGVNISKIPLLGYVIAGEKKDPTTSIQISGDFENPHIQNTVMKDVVSLPFEVLYRTLKLPSHLVEKAGKGRGDTN